jgi:pentatricopeptide repeat protein
MVELWSDISNRFGSFILASDVLFDLICDKGKLEDAERCFCQMVESKIPAM